MTTLAAEVRPAAPPQLSHLFPSVRPVTLLIACGIVLITAILIAAGLAVGELRGQSLHMTIGEMTRVNGAVGETANRTFAAAEIILGRTADSVRQNGPGSAAQVLQGTASPPPLAALAVTDPGGMVVAFTGTWPTGARDVRGADYFTAVKSGESTAIGAPIPGLDSGRASIPLARVVRAADGRFAGAVIGLLPADELVSLYRPIALPESRVAVLRNDGTILAAYPKATGLSDKLSSDKLSPEEVARLMHDHAEIMINDHPVGGGPWQIVATQPLADFPASALLSRGGDAALADWQQQTVLFAAFVIAGSLGIVAMLYLIARQFRTHAALAAIRAEKIEIEHARLQTEAELLKKERLSVLGQLTATVAHELRNPLSAIRNTLFTVREIGKAAGSKLDRPIARMERSIERCDRIISDLLEYTKTRELRRTAVELDRWLDEVVSEQKLPDGVRVETDLQGGPVIAVIDAERIRRVMINLIENAAQALGEISDSRDKRIIVKSRVGSRGVELVIDDNGPGIPPENRERIFEPLFSTKSFGTGLGLATVKQIVTDHGGTISIDSEVGKGALVTVCLPVAEAERAAA